MNRREMKKFEKLLNVEREHLSKGIRTIEENTLESTTRETGGDLQSFAEAGTDNNERETALRVAHDESEWLREVTDAIERIGDKTYGTCEGCQEAIPEKRLEVFPSARYCIKCQEKLERNGTL